MYISTFIDLIVYIILIEFGVVKLLQWFYEGPYGKEILLAFNVVLFLVLIWLLVGGKTKTD